jgi:hypothetical protein
MTRAIVLGATAVVLAAVALLAVLTTSATSTVRSAEQTLVVGNALRASDLADVGAIAGALVLDADGRWALDHDGTVQPLVVPGGSGLSGGSLAVGSQRFEVGDAVEVRGGTAGGALYFWQITKTD